MNERLVGPLDGIPEGAVVVVDLGEVEVGVLRIQGQLRAYENRCPHQGGPVCYGRLLGRQEGIVDAERRLVGERLSAEVFNLVCPWHGWSYDALTGENIGDRHFRLKPWDVEVRGGQVYLLGPAGGGAHAGPGVGA